MKKYYLLLLFLLFSILNLSAQTTETFENATPTATTFTSNSQVFNITSAAQGPFDIYSSSTAYGWNGTTSDFRFIDNSGFSIINVPVEFTVATAGSVQFTLKSMYLYLANANSTLPPTTGSCSIIGKVGGVTVFTATSSTGFNTSATTNNGYTFIDMASFGGSNNSTINIDSFTIKTTGAIAYVGLDAMKWQAAAAAVIPTVTTAAATNVGAVKATVGGNVTADGGATVSDRGIAWGLSPNPTVPKVPIGTGSGAFSNAVSFPSGTTINYRAYATNSAGTGYGANMTFTTGTALTATQSQTEVTCTGGSDGTATVTPSGGAAPYSYSWTTGATTAAVTGLTAGDYTVLITDNEGTSIAKNFTITQSAGSTITISANPPNRTVCSGFNTTFPATALNAAIYQWQVNTGSGFNNITNGGVYSTATTATLTLTGVTPAMSGYTYRLVASGPCSPSATSNAATLTVPNMTITITAQTNVGCFGEANGGATLSVTGGISPYSYSWSPAGGTGATASGLAAGTYTVTVTDGIFCSKTQTVVISGPTDALNGTSSVTNVSCFGGSNGTATITASGGTPGYTYLWSNGATTATATGLLAGIYSVTITDNKSCTKTINNINVGAPTSVISGIPSSTPVSCFGGSNGSASVTAFGGTPGYTYSWFPSGGNGAEASGLTAGTYSVTITDANSCTGFVNNIVVGGPTAILNGTTSTTAASCFGGNNGTATVTASGGKPGYTYLWFPSGGTDATASGLTAGSYSVTITDINSCTRTINNINVGESPAIIPNPTQTNVSCNGGFNGSASVAPTGGAGSYTYSWSPSGGTGATASGLTAGSYTVTITDANSCTTTQDFTIDQPAVLSATTASTAVSCFGGSNGSASVTVSGGSPTYTYLWAPLGGTMASISGRPAGDYTCTITDANGCSLIKNITISTPAAFSATVIQTNVSCNGGTNGSATITPSGATAPYSYVWAPSGGTAATASGLSFGNYTVTVQDANTCVYTVNVDITQPASLSVIPSQTNVLCNGGNTGTAAVTVTGGTPGYTYIWSPAGGTAATATGLTAGSYNCLITDDKGCTFTQNFNIGEPSILYASTSKMNATCIVGGQASVTPNGGTLPYTYSWSPSGGTDAIATGLAAGNYTCTITDGNGCTLAKSFTISTTNTLVAVTSQTDILCNGDNTGSATVAPAGAPGPFTYVWAPSGGNDATATNLTAGNYSVTITSANGCSIVENFDITEPTPIVAIPSQTNILCNGGTTGDASVTVTGGTGSYTYLWAPSGGTGATATGLAAGTYTVTVQDGNLCQTTLSFTITAPPLLTATITGTNVTCNGANDGSATVTATGGTGLYSYVWSPTGGSAATATGLSPGNYEVTITDENDCSTIANISLTEPLALDTAITQTDVTCIGAADGSAIANTTGGTAPYTYAWAPTGGTDATATGLTAGNYVVTITDANGCLVTKPVNILTTPDVTAPVPDVANLPVINSNCSILSSQIPVPTATDNCTGIINATTTDPLNYANVGSYTITWSYNDGHGNLSAQTQTINVTASPLDLVTFSDAAFTFDGNLHALQVANLPAGATAAYSITPTASTQNGAINAGVYTVTAIVSPAASDPNCSSITFTAQLTINKAPQQITFGAIAPKILGAINNFNLEATSDSGLAIRYSFNYTSALPPANVSAIGLVNLLRSGDLLIEAHQDGDANYLPATTVSQILVIKNNDITVTKITLGNQVYQDPAKEIKYLMECGENNVNAVILNGTSAVITPSANFTINTPKPGIYTQNVTVTSQDGSATANYTLIVEKPFGFYDIVRQKFNNVLIVNNNPQTNGGYEFVAYQWFKNGQQIGTGQYYTAGDDLGNKLDPTGDYSVKMTTKDGKILQTCSTKITTQKAIAAQLYPNPVLKGKAITVEADFPQEELANMQISLYSVSGQLVKTLKSSTVLTEIQLPDAESNMYVVVIETANIKKTLKVIVK